MPLVRLVKNVLSQIRGFASGEAMITGNLANPDIGGEITLVESGLELPYLESIMILMENQRLSCMSILLIFNLSKLLIGIEKQEV